MARATKKKQAVESPAVITAIKGFDSNWQCRSYQFEIGKSYTMEGPIKACASGFHSCPDHPLDVFNFYAPAGNRFAAVEVSGETSRDGIKIASATISLTVELSISDLVRRAWDYVWSRATIEGAASATGYQGAASATGDQGAASATGYQGAASATGDQGAASATGDQGAASATGIRGAASATGDQGAASATGIRGAASATGIRGAASATGIRGAASATGYQGAASATGDQGAASATGYQGAASATGDQGAASATGDQGAASATGIRGAASATGDQGAASATGIRGAALSSGYGGKVLGKNGNALFAVERDDDWNIVSVAAGIVGKAHIKSDTWYFCKDGELVEVRS